MSIFITGDMHGTYSRLNKKRLKKQNVLQGENDYLIQLGDLGILWSNEKDHEGRNRTLEYNLEIFTNKPFTTLWVQGNHENYDMIAEYPVEEWNGGKVRHIIRNKLILLERGQIFEIEGKTFFTFGGAKSHDIQGGLFDPADPDFKSKIRKAKTPPTPYGRPLPYRIIDESWWAAEMPSEEEMEEGRQNLLKAGNKVDYMITHDCPDSIQRMIDPGPDVTYAPDRLSGYLEELKNTVEYRHWFFGHYHQDWHIDEKHSLLYFKILPLEDVYKPEIFYTPKVGCPRFRFGEKVQFESPFEGEESKMLEGTIEIIDAWGAGGIKDEPCYDIICEEKHVFFKHIMESDIFPITHEMSKDTARDKTKLVL